MVPASSAFGWPTERTEYQVRKLHCPQKDAEATVTAASWKTSNNVWTFWQVVDCSLMPAGCMFCNEACLTQFQFQTEVASSG